MFSSSRLSSNGGSGNFENAIGMKSTSGDCRANEGDQGGTETQINYALHLHIVEIFQLIFEQLRMISNFLLINEILKLN
jgi:hypothetical protein